MGFSDTTLRLSFILIKNTFTFKRFSSENFGFGTNIWASLSANITQSWESSMNCNEPRKLRLRDFLELRFSDSEPKPSSVFWLILPSKLHQASEFCNQLI